MTDFPFTPEQRQWIAALRSGEYKQTKVWLETPDGFCCLGVACHLFDRESRRGYPTIGHISYDGRERYATQRVIETLHLRGEVGDRQYGPSLAQMNDAGATFAAIADFIENNPHEVFTNGGAK